MKCDVRDCVVGMALSIGAEVAVGGDAAVQALISSKTTALEDGQRSARTVAPANFVVGQPSRGANGVAAGKSDVK